METLTKMFIQTGILTINRCTPQSSSQYLSQVLVPETAIRLIAEDYSNISLDVANEIMIDSKLVMNLDYTLMTLMIIMVK